MAEHRFDAVVHAGALHKPDIARYPAQAFVDVNVTGTLNVLEAAKKTGVSRVVFTSTTSLMISDQIRRGTPDGAVWITEELAPLAPRNIYGVTKLAAEGLCRLYAAGGLPVVVLRTGRFFPEDDDTLAGNGMNLKAVEFLHRRLTAADAAEAHVAALDHAPALGFETFLVSAPTPFCRADAARLAADAPAVIGDYFPDAQQLFRVVGWQLPDRIDRVYDASKAERMMGFRCRTDFAAILESLRSGQTPPIDHDPTYTSPIQRQHAGRHGGGEATATLPGTLSGHGQLSVTSSAVIGDVPGERLQEPTAPGRSAMSRSKS
jgi:nucleoside-diphosphate-sugar epimerase